MEIRMIDMTDEKKERFLRISHKVIDICKAELNPIETAAVLTLCLDVLKKTYGIERSYMESYPEVPQ